MHSLFCITSSLPYITLCYIDSRFFLPLEQSRMALLGLCLAASRLREAARWQLIHIQTNTNKRSCCFCRRLRLLYSFLTAVSDSYLSCHQEYKMMMQNYQEKWPTLQSRESHCVNTGVEIVLRRISTPSAHASTTDVYQYAGKMTTYSHFMRVF